MSDLILRCTNLDGDKIDLTPDQNVDLRLDISAIENTTIGDVYGVTSQEFTVYGTNNSNQFFGNLFNLGATPAVALKDSVDCQVLYKGGEVFNGRLYVNQVITDSDSIYTQYQVVVVNETVDFKFEQQDKYMSELDFSAFNHDYTYNNITGSWDENLLSGSIIYPNVNYGKPEGDNDAPNLAFSNRNYNTANFDISARPLRVIDFKPAIKLKDVIDTVFSGSIYSYTSSFLNTADFNNIYMLSTANDSLGIGNESPISSSVWVYRSGSTQTINAATPTSINWNEEVINNNGIFNLTTDKYTVNVDGVYSMAAQLDWVISGYTGTERERVVVKLVKNGTTLINSKLTTALASSGTTYINATTTLQAGDYIEVIAELTTTDITQTLLVQYGENDTWFKAQGPPNNTGAGGNVDMSLMFPTDLKVLDFLQGVIEKFNLVFEPVPNERNLIRIETFQDWVDAGVIKDWTDKVDRSQRYSIKHPATEQPKNILFADEQDDCRINQYQILNFGKPYGDREVVADNNLSVGDRKIGKVFAATPVKGIPNGNNFIIPHLCRSDNGIDRPIQFKPRLFYKNGKKEVPSTAFGYDRDTRVEANRYFIKDENGTVHGVYHWYQMSTLSSLPAQVSNGKLVTKDLHFNNLGFYQYFQDFEFGKAEQDAYFTYWSTYINDIYDIDARKVTLNVYLKPAEIQNIALNDSLFIDGHYYRINRINGANLSKRDSVEVELLKQLNRRLNYPRRYFRSPIGTIEIGRLAELTVNGTGSFVYDNGNPITGSYELGQLAPKENMVVYNQEPVWDIQPPIAYLTDFNGIGANDVNLDASKVTVMGIDNSIQQADTVHVFGNSNTVNQDASNMFIIGESHTIDDSQIRNSVIVGGNYNSIISGSVDSSIIASYSSSIQSSSLAAIVGGAQNTIEDGLTSRNLILGGRLTTLSSSQDTVVINSDNDSHTSFTGNTIIGDFQSSDAAITGSDYRFNNTLVNGLYLEEDYYTNRHSYQIEAYSGSTDFAYSGDGLYKYIYEIDFNTIPSGSGKGEIELPTIASQDQIGRTILFKANDSINSGSYVDIVSFADTDDIEGAKSYRLERPGQWVELRASEFPEGESLVTEWRVIRAGVPFESSVTNEGAYGSFYSTQTQTIAASGSAQQVTLNNTFTSNLLALSGSGAIQMDYRGTYSFTYTARVQNADNVIHYADFWIKYNGTDYPNSTVRVSIPARKNASDFFDQPVTVQLLDVAVNNGDVIELYWRGDSTLLSLNYQTFGGAVPASPSVRTTIHAV